MIVLTPLIASIELIIKQAGALVLGYLRKPLVRISKDHAGFVTQADLESEHYLIAELKKVLPQAGFFAEESGQEGSGVYRWVIDPLDGTTNFAYGLPYFCISVALTYHDEPIFGMIYDPLHDELFYALKNQGAFLKKSCSSSPQQLKVLPTSELGQALVFFGTPYTHDISLRRVIHNVDGLARRVAALRHFGAVALDQAQIAAGRADAVFFTNLGWWDVAAGMLLIEEAGGTVTTFEGNRVRPGYQSYVAGVPLVHAELQPFLKKA